MKVAFSNFPLFQFSFFRISFFIEGGIAPVNIIRNAHFVSSSTKSGIKSKSTRSRSLVKTVFFFCLFPFFSKISVVGNSERSKRRFVSRPEDCSFGRLQRKVHYETKFLIKSKISCVFIASFDVGILGNLTHF